MHIRAEPLGDRVAPDAPLALNRRHWLAFPHFARELAAELGSNSNGRCRRSAGGYKESPILR
jgi:hypothetical protein